MQHAEWDAAGGRMVVGEETVSAVVMAAMEWEEDSDYE